MIRLFFLVPTGKFMNIFNGHAGPVTAGQFTPDGKKIVSVSEDTSMIIWDPKTAVAEYRLSGDDARFHPEPITSMAVNKDSTLVISGSMDGKARLVNISNGSVSNEKSEFEILLVHEFTFAPLLLFVDCCLSRKPHRLY
jgi:WD40 repeat protein